MFKLLAILGCLFSLSVFAAAPTGNYFYKNYWIKFEERKRVSSNITVGAHRSRVRFSGRLRSQNEDRYTISGTYNAYDVNGNFFCNAPVHLDIEVIDEDLVNVGIRYPSGLARVFGNCVVVQWSEAFFDFEKDFD